MNDGSENVLLVRNPDSGDGAAERAEALIRARASRVRAVDIEAVAANPEVEGVSRIIVAGGDGSLAPGALAAARAGARFGVVPVGTANDFGRAFELPEDLEQACELAVNGLETRPVDVALIGGRPFLNVASVGLAPKAARRASRWKRRLGPLAYAIGGARAALTAEPVRCGVSIDGAEHFRGDAWQVTVASTGSFGAGSGVPADPGDREIDVVVIEAGRRSRLLRHAYGLRAGSVAEQPGVSSARGARVVLEIDGRTELNVDGEVVGADQLEVASETTGYAGCLAEFQVELVVG